MQKIKVSLRFEGTVVVDVPGNVSIEDANLLAEKIALSRVVATIDNSDAPDEDAFDEYFDECSSDNSEQAEQQWDNSVVEGVSGIWQTTGE